MRPLQIKPYKTTYPSVDSADAPMVDPAVSRYELREKLGEGGMGVVYLARERTLGRLVALKFLSPDLSGSPDEAYRFEQEALAISALNHPSIATIYGFEDSGDQKYLVLEYLPGGTLASRIAR